MGDHAVGAPVVVPPDSQTSRRADREVGDQAQRVDGPERAGHRTDTLGPVGPAAWSAVVVEHQPRLLVAGAGHWLPLEFLGGQEGKPTEAPVATDEVGDELVGGVVEELLRGT